MPLLFDSRDWYWTVAADTSKVYSSKRNIYVDPNTDVDYGNWVASAGGISPNAAANESEIWYYTQAWMPSWWWDGTKMSQPGIDQYYKPQLDNYNALSRFNHVNAGMVAAGVPVKTDDYSRGLIQGGLASAQANPDFTAQWFGSDGQFYTIDAAQMIEMATVVGNHTNDCYTVFSGVANDILTNAITQPTQIDAAYVSL
jgi:hypothetical protein